MRKQFALGEMLLRSVFVFVHLPPVKVSFDQAFSCTVYGQCLAGEADIIHIFLGIDGRSHASAYPEMQFVSGRMKSAASSSFTLTILPHDLLRPAQLSLSLSSVFISTLAFFDSL